MSLADVILITGVTLSGLGAGIFLSFSAGIMPGLARVDDAVFVAAMTSINRAVLNPLFLVPIFLPPVFLGGAGVLLLPGARGWVAIAAAVVFAVGVVLITMIGNVPLNNALDTSSGPASALRFAFESRWRALNNARTLSGSIATVTACGALIA